MGLVTNRTRYSHTEIPNGIFPNFLVNGKRQCFQILFMWPEIHQGKYETHVLLFTSISYECKHVSDQPMLVFCFCSHMFMVYLRTTEVHNNSVFKELALLFLLQKSPHAFGFPIVNTPHSFGIPVQRTPLPFRNPKSRPCYRYGYFLESPNIIYDLEE